MPLDTPADKGKGCIEFSVRGEPADAQALRADFLSVAQELNVDIAFQRDSLFRRNRRAVMQSFLRRERIFLTDHFHSRMEDQARRNITAELNALG